MDPVTIKGIAATITYDGQQVSIKHRMMGTVTTLVQEILGVDLKEARGPISGKLRIATSSASHRGLMPKQPWEIQFTYKQAEEFKALYLELMQARHRGQ